MTTPDVPVACSLCGAAAGTADAARAAGWTWEVDPRRGPVWLCTDCARRYLRSIEARLDQEWW